MKSPFSKLAIIKLPRHRRFDFPTRHYDESKERLEKRKQIIAQELGVSENGDERTRRDIDFRAKLQNSRVSNYNANASRSANLRLVLILGILLTACYAIYINMDSVIATLSK